MTTSESVSYQKNAVKMEVGVDTIPVVVLT